MSHCPINRPAFTRRHRKTNAMSQVPMSQTNQAIFATIGIQTQCPNDSNLVISQATDRHSQHPTQMQLECPNSLNVPTNRPAFTRQTTKTDPMSQPTDRHLQHMAEKQTACSNDSTLQCRNVPCPNQPTFVRHHRKITRMSQRSQCPNQPGAYSRPKNNKIISSRMSRVPCPNHSQFPVLSGCQRCNLPHHCI